MGYIDLPFWRFAIGIAVVSLPVWVLDQAGEDRWAWRYVALILLMMIGANASGVQAFSRFVVRESRDPRRAAKGYRDLRKGAAE